jgi:transposase-like protein
MEHKDIQLYFKNLTSNQQDLLLSDLEFLKDNSEFDLLSKRSKSLDNKQSTCPRCNSIQYVKNGSSNGVKRYKCKSCKRSFTAYTGTWLAHIHKKDLLIPYLKLMKLDLSLDKIKLKLRINKKTALDWRHKISHSVSNIEEGVFTGITESDETFFLHSNKGAKINNKPARKRGKSVNTKGISREQVAVIASTDRKKTISIKVACLGRIKKVDIENAIGQMHGEQTVLCSDGHVSYKGFAKDNHIEHHILRANIKEYVVNKKYHIQHINSMHNRMKYWINKKMLGVATKNLQGYMNWFHLTEKYTDSQFINKIIEIGCANTNAINSYKEVRKQYELLKTG